MRGETARCFGSCVSKLLLPQLNASMFHDSCCVLLEENKRTRMGKSACIGSAVLGEGCQNSTRKWEGEVLVEITAPDQDSNTASLAYDERTGDSCFSFQ